MFRRQPQNVDHFIDMVSGYLMVDEEVLDGEEEDDFEDEEEDIQFLNYKEMNGVGNGKQLYEGRKMKSCKGVLKDLDRVNKSNRVAAPFHFTDQWWKIFILRTRIIDRHRCPKDMTSLTYKIRQDDSVVKDKLVNMFLTKQLNTGEHANDSYVYIDQFLQFVRQSGNGNKLKFEHLEELMHDFEQSLPEDLKFSAERVLKALDTTEWSCISKAVKFPKLVSHLSQLLPMQFKALMENPKNEDLVRDLSRALDIKPWVFGFKNLLYKDYNLAGCEASLLSIKRADIFDSLEQVNKDALVIYDFLKTDSRQHGHTQISLDRLKQKLEKDCPDFDDAMKFLKRNKVVKETEIEHDPKVCLQQLWNYERKISEGIRDLYKKQCEDPMELEVDLNCEEFEKIRGDKEQFEAAKMLLKYPVVVISGKGGCGKTTVVTKVLSYQSDKKEEVNDKEKTGDSDEGMSRIEDWNDYKLSQKTQENISDPDFPDQALESQSEQQIGNQTEDNSIHIIYTAPTGKAANLLGRRAKTTGYTLHQIIWSYRFYVTRTLKENPDAEWKFQNVNTLVVDECSMVAVSTFSTILTTLLENAKLRKVVLLGDIRQLPSIEPGNFLADIYRSMFSVKSAIELMTNHRAESELIVQNATAISLKQYPIFSPKHNFFLHEVPQSTDKNTDMHDHVVQRILHNEPSIQDDKRSQFVTFTNKYCDWINEHACKVYNKHPTRNHKNKLDFKINDKICLKKNGMVIVYEEDDRGRINVKYLEGDLEPEEAADVMEVTLMSQTLNSMNMSETLNPSNTTVNSGDTSNKKKKKTPATIRLCNGEIYFIKAEVDSVDNRGKSNRYLKFSDEDPDCPREFWVNYKEVMRKCKMKHSWARTIHTFQGSECENLVYVLGFCPVQNWQHVYTAVTRGKKAVHIVGTKQHLRKAIQKDPDKRNTTLYHQLEDMLPVEEILNKLVFDFKNMSEQAACWSQKDQKFTVLKDKKKTLVESSSYLNSNLSATTPMRNGYLNRQADSPFSDSQWSDYGDDTYIEATQVYQNCAENENSFDLMDSLEMTENSEVLGDLTAACDLLEASMAKENQLTSVKYQNMNSKSDSFSNYQENNGTSRGSNSSDTSNIEEFDSFSSVSSPPKRPTDNKLHTTPKKKKTDKTEVGVSPTRRMLSHLGVSPTRRMLSHLGVSPTRRMLSHLDFK